MGFILTKGRWDDVGFINLNVSSAAPVYIVVGSLLVGGGGGSDWSYQTGNGGDGGYTASPNLTLTKGVKYTIVAGQGGNAPSQSTNGNSSYSGTTGLPSSIIGGAINQSVNGGFDGASSYGVHPVINRGGYGASVNAPTGIIGGNGTTSLITGTSIYYAGGGGGYNGATGTSGLGTIGAGGLCNGAGGNGGANGAVILAIPTASFNASGVNGATQSSGWPTYLTRTIVTWAGMGYYIA